MDLSQWWRVFLTTFDQNHDQKCGKSLTSKASCKRNMFCQNKQWMEYSVVTFWAIEGKHLVQTSRQVTQQLLGLASWRSSSCVTHCVAVFGFYEDDDSHPPPILLTGPRPRKFFLFPKMKLKLKGQHFDSTEEIQNKLQKVMKTLMQNDFQKCFWSWKSCWNCCISAKGDYFEEDGGKEKFQ